MCHGKCIGIPKSMCPHFKNEDCTAPPEFIDTRLTWGELRGRDMVVIKGMKSESKDENGKATFAPWQVTSIFDQSLFQDSRDMSSYEDHVDYPMPGEFVNC